MNKYQAFLALGMLITGSINTIANKLADGERSKGVWADGCPASPPPAAPPPPNFPLSPGLAPPPPAQACKFIHPFFQALVMFIGEASCLVVFFSDRCVRSARGQPVEKVQPFNKFIFLLPACCDMTATSLMYIGLLLTYASVFQMLRSSVVLFTAIISRVFLKKQLQPFHWVGCALVLAGTVIVGLDSVINPAKDASSSAPNSTLGNALIIASQLIVAIQMCVEEVFVGAANVAPLLAVGLEGVFGASMLTLLLIPMYYAIPGIENLSETSQHFEDSYDALLQLGNNAVLLLWVLGGLFSIAFFNFFGISVTKNMSAAHRMVLDSLRTMVVWGYSLATGQAFSWLQLGGFVVLLLGTLVYNEILRLRCLPAAVAAEPLLLGADAESCGPVSATRMDDSGSLTDSPTEPIVVARGQPVVMAHVQADAPMRNEA